jgi:hypothetical protein
MHKLNCGKSRPKIWAASEIKKKLANVNNRPMGENSPNLVTQKILLGKALQNK